MKSIKMFGKSVPLLAIVMISVLVVGASAGLLAFYGRIETTATVEQAVLIDGQDITTSPVLGSFTVTGGDTVCEPHWLQNRASVSADVQLDTVSPAGVIVTYDVQITDDDTDFGDRSNEVVAFSITSGLTLDELFAGDGLQYIYTVLDGGSYDGAAPAVPVIDLANGWNIVLFPGWGGRTGTHTLTFGENGASDTGGNLYADFVVYFQMGVDDLDRWSNTPSHPAWIETKALLDCPVDGSEVVTRIALQHQAANTGQKDRIESLSIGTDVHDFMIDEATLLTLGSGITLDFYICYEFDVSLGPDTYTMTTTVSPSPLPLL